MMLLVNDVLRDSYMRVDTSEPVSQALAALEKEKEVFVTDENFVGLFQPHQLSKSKVDITTMKARKVAKHVPKLAVDDNLLQAADLLWQSNTTALPVIDENKMVGVVHVYDVFEHIDELGGDELTVDDARTPDAFTVHEDKTVQQAMGEMRDKGVDRFPVTDGKTIIGFLSSSDIARKFQSHHNKQDKGHKPDISTRAFVSERHAAEVPVKDMMNKNVLRIERDATLSEAAKKMYDEQVLSLLVQDSILTKRDVLEAVTERVQEVEATIQYKGWNQIDVDGHAKDQAKKTVENTAKKIRHFIHNEFELTVHVKKYQKEGARGKYSVKARIHYPGGKIVSDKKHGWEFIQAVQEAMEALTSQAQKEFQKGNKGRPSPRYES